MLLNAEWGYAKCQMLSVLTFIHSFTMEQHIVKWDCFTQ
jgi:hypothetical protein